MPPAPALADYLSALSQLVRELLDEEGSGESGLDEPTPGERDDEEEEESESQVASGVEGADPDDEEEEESESQVASGVEGADPDDEEEDDDTAPARQQSPAARNRRLVRNFVRRNLAVLEQPGFREGAGPGIVIPNAIILNWVCWWIATKDEAHGPDLVDERLRLWALLWGQDDSEGYLEALDDEHQALVLERFDAQRFEPVLAASIADVWSSIATVHDPLYRRLRAILRRAVRHACWQFTARHLDEAATLTNKRPSTLDPIDAAEIVERLWEAACEPHFGNEPRVSVAAAMGCQPAEVVASKVEVIVDGRSDRRAVDQMEITSPVAAPSVEAALTSWMGVEGLDHYRLKWPAGVAFYNALTESGWVVQDEGDERALECLRPTYPPWRVELDRLVDSVDAEAEAAA